MATGNPFSFWMAVLPKESIAKILSAKDKSTVMEVLIQFLLLDDPSAKFAQDDSFWVMISADMKDLVMAMIMEAKL